VGDVRAVVNCHLHLDHSGGNQRFPGTPIFAQRTELDAAQTPDYTLPDVYDFEGATFEIHDGEADVAPGVRIVPTPGHTEGHQSLVVQTREGVVVLAGQAYNAASDYARAQYAWELDRDGSADRGPYLEWVARMQEFDPWRVLFAHDVSIWERDDHPRGGTGL
jgi:glyoxylase-like metal-dependent hydrolase (beta-lactamase superfamily II)